MLLAALLAFVCVVAALTVAALLVRHFIRRRDLYLFGWASASLALAVGAAGLALGGALGFDELTFRSLLLGGGLLAPAWLAWGSVELGARTMPPVFGARLVAAAFTVVGGVILVIDPVKGDFGTSMPDVSEHYMVFPKALLVIGYLLSAATIITYIVLTVLRRDERGGTRRLTACAVAGGGGLLLVLSSALGLPGIVHALVLCGVTGAVWYGGTRKAIPPEDEDEDEDEPDDTPDEELMRDRRVARRSEPMREPPREPGPVEPPRGRRARHGGGSPLEEMRRQEAEPGGGPNPYADTRVASAPMAPGAGFGPGETGRGEPDGAPEAVTELYGLISIFSLVEGQGEFFDRLAADVVAVAREREPDTLIYVCHSVPNAPLQRIFYEVYRDRSSYDAHGRQPHVQRFRAERARCVQGTNVIELTVNAAKVAQLGALFGAPTRP